LVAAAVPLLLILLALAPGTDLIRQFFAAGCHQQPGRCYVIAGHPAALCVRCLWLYFGLAIGHMVFTWAPLREKGAIRLLGCAVVLLLADVGAESLHFYHDWRALRASTGFFFGFGCAWFSLQGLAELLIRPDTQDLNYDEQP
jgi:uncharacterized membrane protein